MRPEELAMQINCVHNQFVCVQVKPFCVPQEKQYIPGPVRSWVAEKSEFRLFLERTNRNKLRNERN